MISTDGDFAERIGERCSVLWFAIAELGLDSLSRWARFVGWGAGIYQLPDSENSNRLEKVSSASCRGKVDWISNWIKIFK